MGERSLIDGAIIEFVREVFSSSTQQEDKDKTDDAKLEEWDKLAETRSILLGASVPILVSCSRVGSNEKGRFITKGAVEEVLDRCARVYDHPSSFAVKLTEFKPGANTTLLLTLDTRRQILEMAERFNGEGLRLVAVACKSAVAMSFMTVNT
jgi:Mg2+-importing ATPase